MGNDQQPADAMMMMDPTPAPKPEDEMKDEDYPKPEPINYKFLDALRGWGAFSVYVGHFYFLFPDVPYQ